MKRQKIKSPGQRSFGRPAFFNAWGSIEMKTKRDTKNTCKKLFPKFVLVLVFFVSCISKGTKKKIYKRVSTSCTILLPRIVYFSFDKNKKPKHGVCHAVHKTVAAPTLFSRLIMYKRKIKKSKELQIQNFWWIVFQNLKTCAKIHNFC